MDLILWRHAQAHDHPDGPAGQQGDDKDLARPLTSRGEKQAVRMARWLDRQLPQGALILCSPAVRAEQTALALGRKLHIVPALAPEADALAVLDQVQWPVGKSPCVVVAHQPTLGRVIARLLNLPEDACPVRKGTVWWLRQRERNGRVQTVLVCVQTPELL